MPLGVAQDVGATYPMSGFAVPSVSERGWPSQGRAEAQPPGITSSSFFPEALGAFICYETMGKAGPLCPSGGDCVRTAVLCVTSVHCVALVGEEVEMRPLCSRLWESTCPGGLWALYWADALKVTSKSCDLEKCKHQEGPSEKPLQPSGNQPGSEDPASMSLEHCHLCASC